MQESVVFRHIKRLYQNEDNLIHKKNILIVGQGIGGSLLAYFAQKKGYNVTIIDHGHATNTSMISSGIINPVTGRKYVKSWMIDQFLNCAIRSYKEIGDFLSHQVLLSAKIWRHVPDVLSENTWNARLQDNAYEGLMSELSTPEHLKSIFKEGNKYGQVQLAYRVDGSVIIKRFRQKWMKEGILHHRPFNVNDLNNVETRFHYDGKIYDYVILATGHYAQNDVGGFECNAYRPVKGEILIIESPDLQIKDIVKFGKFIVPLGQDKYWIGSNYQHDFDSTEPDMIMRRELEVFLNDLPITYRVLDHLTGIRPATRFRRPLIGEHPRQQNLFLFNGLGTKGFSMAPYFSQLLVESLEQKTRFSTETFRKVFE